jgi:7-carboxy-7-deazaguanine synthase
MRRNSPLPDCRRCRPTSIRRRGLSVRLKLTEIFHSLQGEADTVGIPTVFVRLTGCPLRCQYCDTAYAFHGGEWWQLDAILARVRELGAHYVCVTGGEPLAQPACLALLSALAEAGYRVSLETSGAVPIDAVDARVIRVVDVKTPGSREEHRNRYQQLALLRPEEQVKFVLCDRADYEWSRDKLAELQLAQRCQVLFSPSHEQLPARELADWILADRLPVRFQIQLHKYLWGNEPGR